MDVHSGGSRTLLPYWRLQARQRAADWGGVIAGLLGAWGAGEVLRWANRWYVAERIHAKIPPQTVEEWQGEYDLLHKTHSTLVFAIVLLLLAGASAGIAIAARRSLRRAG